MALALSLSCAILEFISLKAAFTLSNVFSSTWFPSPEVTVLGSPVASTIGTAFKGVVDGEIVNLSILRNWKMLVSVMINDITIIYYSD